MTKLAASDIAGVKGRGFLHNRGTDTFSGRIVTKNGVMTAEQLLKVAECAEKYGAGRVCYTSRLCVEMPGIHLEDIDAASAMLAEVGLGFGGTGAKVRPVTACKGTTCVYGNADTQGIALRLHEVFYEGWRSVVLPHKFKISVGGCPNSCMKPSLNDFGIEAHRVPVCDKDACKGCKKCMVTEKCPMKAASLKAGKLVVDKKLCTDCGVCTRSCPFGAVNCAEEPVFAIYVGGTWGKRTRIGTRLSRYYGADELEMVLEKTLLWYRKNGYAKERLGAAIDRIGIKQFEKDIASDDLIKDKEAILAQEIMTR
ncbi:MAG: 4Fe-4S binding protein [Clostridia bacterium]|nr:4Fe-4S binding protein [Clostridia bacterium]